jgi:hypothetical protein
MRTPREVALEPDQVRDEAVAPLDEAVEAESIETWGARARFFFIVGAAALCWVVPGVAIYLLVSQY